MRDSPESLFVKQGKRTVKAGKVVETISRGRRRAGRKAGTKSLEFDWFQGERNVWRLRGKITVR